MAIFYESGFEDGRWAGSLAMLLRKKNLIPGLVARGRIWRGDWRQWIQYETPGFPGSLFWIGKPAIRSNKEFLFAGYYIEKGFTKHEKADYQLTDKWHWHGFVRCLKDEDRQGLINDSIISLPQEHRSCWIETDDMDKSYPYVGKESLRDIQTMMDGPQKNLWLNVMLGVCFSKEECLNLQERIVGELQKPIITANDIDEIVKNGML